MRPDPTIWDYLGVIAARWRFLTAVVAATVLLTLVVTRFLPRKYTTTSTIIIDPPATNDTRTATALNPTYLESLHTFEHFFTSDTQFQQAAQRFHLSSGDSDIETLRQKVLKVTMPHGTRILQVSATLPDPLHAKQLVDFITENSIAASRAEALGADRDTLANVTAEVERGRTRFEKALSEWERAAKDDTPDSIQSVLEAKVGLHSTISRYEEEAKAEADGWQARAEAGTPDALEYAKGEARAAAVKQKDFAARADKIAAEIAANRKLLAERSGRLTTATAELESARKALDSAQARLRDFSALEGMRSERMRVIDPGVVSRKPSSPNALLNAISAALLAACLGVAWILLRAGDKSKPAALVLSAQRSA
jgi:uncharacterized protein involved in exopolysaccharide biosynthesis